MLLLVLVLMLLPTELLVVLVSSHVFVSVLLQESGIEEDADIEVEVEGGLPVKSAEQREMSSRLLE